MYAHVNPYSQAFKAAFQLEGVIRQPLETSNVFVAFTKCLNEEVETFLAKGHQVVGGSEFILRNDYQGISFAARDHAAAIGAHVAVVEWTSAKVRAIKFGLDGRIDMGPVLADPPKSIQPRGHSVVRAVFLAKLN